MAKSLSSNNIIFSDSLEYIQFDKDGTTQAKLSDDLFVEMHANGRGCLTTADSLKFPLDSNEMSNLIEFCIIQAIPDEDWDYVI